MSRLSVPLTIPSYHIQLKSTDRRSFASGAGVYGAPAFGSLFRPRPPCPPAGACAPTVDARPMATIAPSAKCVQRGFIDVLQRLLILLRRRRCSAAPAGDRRRRHVLV